MWEVCGAWGRDGGVYRGGRCGEVCGGREDGWEMCRLEGGWEDVW